MTISKERESNFELLRLLCIFGIVCMHGSFAIESSSIFNVLNNTLFNNGVSVFILISGYFSVQYNRIKLINLWLVIDFFSIFGVVLLFFVGIRESVNEVLRSFFPIILYKYWFISCYFALCVLSPFLNRISEKFEKKTFLLLLGILFLLFSIPGSIPGAGVIHDGGKGLINMIFLYLVGRYLRLYIKESKNILIPLMIFIGIFILSFYINYSLSLLCGRPYYLASRDSSLFVLFSSITLFQVFRKIHFSSDFINKSAKYVLVVYVLEGSLRVFIMHYMDISLYVGKWYSIFIVYGLAFAVVCLSVCAGVVNDFVFSGVRGRIAIWLEHRVEFMERCGDKILSIISK